MAATLTLLLCAFLGAEVIQGRESRDSGSFNVHVMVRGTPFDESLVVDLVNELELIHVPAHNEVSETVFLVDFEKNATVLKLPQLGRCYVSEIDAEKLKMNQPNLKLALERAQARPQTTAAIAIKDTWRVEEELTDRVAKDILSQTARDLCDGLPVYRLRRQLSYSSPEPKSESGQVHVRHRRQEGIDIPNTCWRENQRIRCVMGIASCEYKYVTTCDSIYDETVREHRPDCGNVNSMDGCCTGCCIHSGQSNNEFPYCRYMTLAQVRASCITAG